MLKTTDEISPLEEELGIRVVKQEQYAVWRQTVEFIKKEHVGAALAYLQSQLHEGKVTGQQMFVNMGQGGIMSVVIEQHGKIRRGSEQEELMDEVFRPNSK